MRETTSGFWLILHSKTLKDNTYYYLNPPNVRPRPSLNKVCFLSSGWPIFLIFFFIYLFIYLFCVCGGGGKTNSRNDNFFPRGGPMTSDPNFKDPLNNKGCNTLRIQWPCLEIHSERGAWFTEDTQCCRRPL